MNKRLKLILTAIASLVLALSVCTPVRMPFAKRPPEAVRGMLDAGSWNFEKLGPLKLDGEWEVHWNKLHAPRDWPDGKTGQPDYFTLPGAWSGQMKQKGWLPGSGYATFRLVIRLAAGNEAKALRLPPIATAYKLWIDGQPAVVSGKVGVSPAEMVPEEKVRTVAFRPSGPTTEIVIQVANFVQRKGGIWESIELGTERQIADKTNLRNAFDALQAGILLLAGLFHLGFYAFQKNDKSALFFGLFAAIMCLRTLLVGEMLLAKALPDIPWEFSVKIEYLTMLAGVPIFAFYLHSLFPSGLSGTYIRFAQSFAIIAGLMVVVFPARVYTHLLPLFHAFVLLIVFYAAYMFAQAIAQRRTGAVWIGAPGMFFGLTAAGDVLSYHLLIPTGSHSPLGMFVFVIAQSFLLIRRISGAIAEEDLPGKSGELRAALETSSSAETASIEDIDANLHVFGQMLAHTAQLTEAKARPESRILIVDDEPVDLQVLFSQLAPENYSVVAATNGPQAIRTIREQNRIDLVILDANMPAMSGLEVCRAIREQYSLMELPVLLMVSKHQPEIVCEGFDAGANDCMMKPFDKKELLARVKSLLTMKQAVQEATWHANKLEKLNRELTELNNSLEQNIMERTLSLQQSNQKLEEMNENLERIERSRIRLLTNISHDLRTPITSIQGYVEAILDGVVTEPDETRKYLRLIHAKSLTLSRLIQDLFELAQLESRQAAFRMREVPTPDLVRQIKEKFELDVTAHGIRFEIHDTLVQPVVLNIDTDRLDQVFANIIFNALKYTPKNGTIAVSFEKRLGHAFKEELVVKVSDSGAGIAKEDLPYIFERFYKGSPRSTSGKGSGLGLAIAKEIVEYHGGRIWAESEIGKGCTIFFTLPIFY